MKSFAILTIFLSFFGVLGGRCLSGQFAFITPEELQRLLKKEQVIVLDARPEARYLKGHIPSALNFSWEKFTSTDSEGIKYRLRPPSELARALGNMGISEDATIVAYGDAASSWGGEGWILWVLEYLGHKGCLFLLNGGLKAWVKEGFPLEARVLKISHPVMYHWQLRPEVNCDTQWLKKHRGEINVIDTRSLPEYLAGHLPGAIHIHWKTFLGEDGYLKSRAEILRILRSKGVKPDRPTVYYCTGGVRSGFTYSIHRIYDLGPVRNFEGGMEEWLKRSKRSR